MNSCFRLRLGLHGVRVLRPVCVREQGREQRGVGRHRTGAKVCTNDRRRNHSRRASLREQAWLRAEQFSIDPYCSLQRVAAAFCSPLRQVSTLPQVAELRRRFYFGHFAWGF
jgi:hypothetical protein